MLVLLLVESDLKRKWDTSAILIVQTQLSDPGPPRPIFGRQGLHNGGHINGMPPLRPPISNLQNPGKAQALGALPAVAALETIKLCTVAHYQLTGLACLLHMRLKRVQNLIVAWSVKVHSFCKQCLHKDLVFINWQLMSALASLERVGEEDLAFINCRSCITCLPNEWPLANIY